MKNDFNVEKYTIMRLQPKAEHIELNKCTHNEINDDNKCVLCGTKVNANLKSKDLLCATNILINHLESMKMLTDYMSKKERKAAQKYFDMIPLLKNISSLYNICNEKANNMNEFYKELIESNDKISEEGDNDE